MLSKRFFISWIISSIAMFAAFYVWHGVVLNDFIRLSYPKEIFLVIASIVYLAIGLAVNKTYESGYFEPFKKNFFLRGAIAGAACGLVIYLISTVVGVSFSNKLSVTNLLFDLGWQIVEQSIGGIVISLTHIFIFNGRAFHPDHND